MYYYHSNYRLSYCIHSLHIEFLLRESDATCSFLVQRHGSFRPIDRSCTLFLRGGKCGTAREKERERERETERSRHTKGRERKERKTKEGNSGLIYRQYTVHPFSLRNFRQFRSILTHATESTLFNRPISRVLS